MLTPEERVAHLKRLSNENWRADANDRASTLPEEQQHVVANLVVDSSLFWQQSDQERLAASHAWAEQVLDAMSDADRLAVFTAVHPRLGTVLARHWVDLRRAPYTIGYRNRVFRSPTDLDGSRHRRFDAMLWMVSTVGPYAQDAAWLAAWATAVTSGWGRDLGPLLATAIDAGAPDGDRVLDAVIDVLDGNHPDGRMGVHIITALLDCGRPEAWDRAGRLLLAAQREEGLRHSILSHGPSAHPGAFTLMLDLVLRHDLVRFAATVQVANEWLGSAATVEDLPTVRSAIGRLQHLLLDPAELERALISGSAWDVQCGLRVLALSDVLVAADRAIQILTDRDADSRAVALRFLESTQMVRWLPTTLAAMTDPDLAVAAVAYHASQTLLYSTRIDPYSAEGIAYRASRTVRAPAAFDAYAELDVYLSRLPTTAGTSAPIGTDLTGVVLDRDDVLRMMVEHRGTRSTTVFADRTREMGGDGRATLAVAAKEEAHSAEVGDALRALLLTLVADRSSYVRRLSLEALADCQVEPAQAPELERLLTRKANDLRLGVIGLLLRQGATSAADSAGRLWRAGDAALRDAAVGIVVALAADAPASSQVVALREEMLAGPVTAQQRDQLTASLDVASSDESESDARGGPEPPPTHAPAPSVYDPYGDGFVGLGLVDTAAMTTPTPPRAPADPQSFRSPLTTDLLSELEALVVRCRDRSITRPSPEGDGEVEILFGDLQFPPSPFDQDAYWRGDGAPDFVLAEVFRDWWSQFRASNGAGPRDLLAARTALQVVGWTMPVEDRAWWNDVLQRLVTSVDIARERRDHVLRILGWLLADDVGPDLAQLCLDAHEVVLAAVRADVVAATPGRQIAADRSTTDWADLNRRGIWRVLVERNPWAATLHHLLRDWPDLVGPELLARWLGLVRWVGEPVPDAQRLDLPVDLVARAHDVGVATDDDVAAMLLQHRAMMLGRWTLRRRDAALAEHPRGVAVADRLRDRIVELEGGRGDLPTVASAAALSVSSVHGTGSMVRLLSTLGRSHLQRGRTDGVGRDAVISHLIRVSYPAPGETSEDLASAVAAHGIPHRTLVELAVYAPQWAAHVEQVIGWSGLEDAVWWFHAHTKDTRWVVPYEVRETWAAQSAARTDVPADDLAAGAVDVSWFQRAYERLGGQRWASVHAAAKFASDSAGHRRAQLYSAAMLGDAEPADLVRRIVDRRNQDAVRSLGLVPIEGDRDVRFAIALQRYGVIREFERTTTQFGSMRQHSERTAARIGIENLARTMGAGDAQRFTWSMEAAEAGALADGPVVSDIRDGVAVELSVDTEGVAHLAVSRAGRTLKSVPAPLRKLPAVVELRQRLTALTRQASRVRESLESAMVREERFDEDDLAALDRHPVLAPMLRLLVFVDDDGATLRRGPDGYRDVHAAARDVAGTVRIAHPLALAATGTWSAWQQSLIEDAHRQPFKQVFREVYVPTAEEASGRPSSDRYAGHQLQPRQAAALLRTRGWLADYESQLIGRVFRHAGIATRMALVEAWGTPGVVELPTLDAVSFIDMQRDANMAIGAVPPIVFSETMRDLDLVVSVAHAGGVDPEASASTVDMRAALVRETARLARLTNVDVREPHVLIEGTLGEYSLHLGSGVVHRRPGGAVCIVPVDSQRRGRIFLPFADPDPRTAEVVAKVLLLAEDHRIRDPSILAQLR